MLTPGSVFAGYRIERMLGCGGMGDVYLARHPRLPRSDALKLMSEELSSNEVYRQLFSSEADLACLVQHESVVRVYDRGEDDGRLWLATEYIEASDLAELLSAEGRFRIDRSVALLERIAAALDAIHAQGLLHRAVKPASILVARDRIGSERALLTDFGSAQSAVDSLGLTRVGDVVATVHYAAPEQFELPFGELDRRVDVYALGWVLYEMLTGKVALEGDSVAAFRAVLQTQTPLAPSRIVAGIPAPLDAVLAKALSKRREDRYDTAGELAQAARAAIAGLPEASAPGSMSPTEPAPSPTGKGWKALFIGAGAAVLIAAAVVATLVLMGGKKAVPGIPGGVSVVAGRGTVTVKWTTSSGKVDHYVVYRDGKPVAPPVKTTSKTTYYVDKLNDTATHRYSVQAGDAKGAVSQLSAVAAAKADIRELNAAENALLAKTPSTLVDAASCRPILAGVDTNLNLAISCLPKAGQTVTAPGKVPQVVEVYGAASLPQLKAALNAEITARSAKPGSCSNVPQHGTWNFTETPRMANGQIVCYRTTKSSLLWSYDKQLFYVKISTTESYASLLAYWEDAALHLP